MAILNFVKEAEKRIKNYQANSPGPKCIVQIFGNGQSRDFKCEQKQNEAEAAGGLRRNREREKIFIDIGIHRYPQPPWAYMSQVIILYNLNKLTNKQLH